MMDIPRCDQLVCVFLIAVIPLLLGSSYGSATVDPVQPLMRLQEVKPYMAKDGLTLSG
jgi:hypothetical protein